MTVSNIAVDGSFQSGTVIQFPDKSRIRQLAILNPGALVSKVGIRPHL